MQALVYRQLGDVLKKQESDLSPGLKFGLFYKGWEGPEGAKPYCPVDKDKRKALEQVCDINRVSQELLEGIVRRQGEMAEHCKSMLIFNQEVYSQAPFVTGIGLEHPIENGFSFLTPYGLPYLPGSSVKGVVRRAAEELALFEPDPHAWDIVKVWWLFGFDENSAFFKPPDNKAPKAGEEEKLRWRSAYAAKIDHCDKKLIEALVGTLPDEKDRNKWSGRPKEFMDALPEKDNIVLRRSIHLRGALSFWDVFPRFKDSKAKLRVDIMNPHYGHYYQDGKPPGDWGSPKPIFFLTVPEESLFRFVVEYVPSSGTHEILAGFAPTGIVAAMAFAFDWLGFGAKTSIGYGRMGGGAAGIGKGLERSSGDAESFEAAKPIDLYSDSHVSQESQPTSEQDGSRPALPRIIWRNATLTWKPDRQEIVATLGNKRAFSKDKDSVPECLRKKLIDKRKSVTATVEVEPEGNSFRIVNIEAPG